MVSRRCAWVIWGVRPPTHSEVTPWSSGGVSSACFAVRIRVRVRVRARARVRARVRVRVRVRVRARVRAG